jgi:protein-tyrosine sulfotransferase
MNPHLNRLLTAHPALQAWAYAIRGTFPSLKPWSHLAKVGYRGENILIIAGAGRSGNTVLRRLIFEAADIYIPPESYFLSGMVETILSNSRLCWASQVDLALGALEYQTEFSTFGIDGLRKFALSAKNWPETDRQLGYLVVELYRWIAHQKNISAQWVGDKTPLNTLRLGLIHRLFPSGCYVYIERDPFDVVASYVNAGLYADYLQAADRWLQSKRAWKSFRCKVDDSKAYEVRYEHLVASPSEETARLMRKLGIPAREACLNVNSVLGDVGLLSHHRRVLDHVTTSRIGASRVSLPQTARKALAELLNAEAVASGYPPL